MSTTTETTSPMPAALLAVVDSALLRQDIEALLEAVRKAEDSAEEDLGSWPSPRVKVARFRWEKVLERADLLAQSYALAKARAAGAQGAQGQGAGR